MMIWRTSPGAFRQAARPEQTALTAFVKDFIGAGPFTRRAAPVMAFVQKRIPVK